MSFDQIILLAIPVFMLLMLAEWAYGCFKGRNTYGLGDTLSSLGQGLISQVSGVFTQIFQIGLYTLLFPHLNLFGNATASVWHSPWGWVLAVILYDFCDYWLHRVSHERAVFWAAHVVHHQSQHFNFSTALRQESAYFVLGWIFYLPLALIGVPPEQYAVAGVVVLVYQFWIHTEHIGKLGWLDRWFSTPSNHRVHHATNERFLDRNYGAILVVWDRMFGTFQEEDEPCVYGTLTPLDSWGPVDSLLQVYRVLLAKLRHAATVRQALAVLFKSPAWAPPGFAVSHMQAERKLQTPALYKPAVGSLQRCLAVLLFLLLALETLQILWQDELLLASQRAVAAALILLGLCCVGRLMTRREGTPLVLLAGLTATALCQLSCLPLP
ncbi:MAG TPA: sterol desaturase family protein [Burkholderiaceae bacterium]|jgi:sterol desaturase/sphingolipid hydroxylase (fatty acid hydroxylase superfamily)